MEKEEEVGRDCPTGRSFGENHELGEMMVLIGSVAGVVDFLQERQYVHLSLLGLVIDVSDTIGYPLPPRSFPFWHGWSTLVRFPLADFHRR